MCRQIGDEWPETRNRACFTGVNLRFSDRQEVVEVRIRTTTHSLGFGVPVYGYLALDQGTGLPKDRENTKCHAF
jgi:hypothetical protein